MTKRLQEQQRNAHCIFKKYLPENGKFTDSENFIFRSCPVCNSGKTHLFAYNKTGYQYVKCKNCSMVYMDPTLKKELIENIYLDSGNNTAKHNAWEKQANTLRPLEKPANTARFHLLLKHSNRGIFLDFGCGFGKLTDQLKFYFDEINGIEIDKYCADYAENIFNFKVYKDFIENLNISDKYDACMSYNNIEHLPEPYKVLKYLNKALKRNGVIFIECPNSEAFCIKLFKGEARTLCSCEHINMFSEKSLKAILTKAGFKPLEVSYRNLDINANEIFTFIFNRPQFYPRACAPLLNGILYRKICSAFDSALNIASSALPKVIPKAYIQIVAQKAYDK